MLVAEVVLPKASPSSNQLRCAVAMVVGRWRVVERVVWTEYLSDSGRNS